MSTTTLYNSLVTPPSSPEVNPQAIPVHTTLRDSWKRTPLPTQEDSDDEFIDVSISRDSSPIPPLIDSQYNLPTQPQLVGSSGDHRTGYSATVVPQPGEWGTSSTCWDTTSDFFDANDELQGVTGAFGTKDKLELYRADAQNILDCQVTLEEAVAEGQWDLLKYIRRHSCEPRHFFIFPGQPPKLDFEASAYVRERKGDSAEANIWRGKFAKYTFSHIPWKPAPTILGSLKAFEESFVQHKEGHNWDLDQAYFNSYKIEAFCAKIGFEESSTRNTAHVNLNTQNFREQRTEGTLLYYSLLKEVLELAHRYSNASQALLQRQQIIQEASKTQRPFNFHTLVNGIDNCEAEDLDKVQAAIERAREDFLYFS